MADCPFTHDASPGASSDLTEFADELRAVWRQISRGTHLSGGVGVLQRQQFWLLGVLNEGPKRMGELADWAHTSQASLTGIVDRLEEAGFVERHRCETDRRVTYVSITDGGRLEVERSRAVVAERVAAMLEPLEESERVEMLRIMRKMTGRP